MAEGRCWNNKAEARAVAQLRVKALAGSLLVETQQKLTVHLNNFLKSQKGRWGAYRSMFGEASPNPSIQSNQHLCWVYPRVRSDVLDFYLEPKAWLKGPFGIEEPDPVLSELVNLQTLEGYLIPGLGFDRTGTRLGRGRGYFDKALKNFRGLKIGVAFEVQVFDEPLPKESFDIPMDVIITDRGVFFTH